MDEDVKAAKDEFRKFQEEIQAKEDEESQKKDAKVNAIQPKIAMIMTALKSKDPEKYTAKKKERDDAAAKEREEEEGGGPDEGEDPDPDANAEEEHGDDE